MQLRTSTLTLGGVPTSSARDSTAQTTATEVGRGSELGVVASAGDAEQG
jgi:hypothetical protein